MKRGELGQEDLLEEKGGEQVKKTRCNWNSVEKKRLHQTRHEDIAKVEKRGSSRPKVKRVIIISKVTQTIERGR